MRHRSLVPTHVKTPLLIHYLNVRTQLAFQPEKLNIGGIKPGIFFQFKFFNPNDRCEVSSCTPKDKQNCERENKLMEYNQTTHTSVDMPISDNRQTRD